MYKIATSGGGPEALLGGWGRGGNRGAVLVSDTVLVIAPSPNEGLAKGTSPDGRLFSTAAELDSLTSASMPASWPTLVWGQTDVLFVRSTAGEVDETDIALLSLESGEARSLINGAMGPRFSPTGHLLFARGSVLHAIEYDPARGETVGSESEILPDVTLGILGVSHYAVGEGVLAYLAGPALSAEFELVWVDRNGDVVATPHQGQRYSDPRLSPDGGRVALTVTEGPNLDVWVLDLKRNTLTPQTRHPGEDFGAVWSPNGSSLAISSEIGEDQGEMGPALAWLPELGGSTEQLFFSPAAGSFEFPTSWAPDGRSIVITTRRLGSSANIALVPLGAERELVQLVETPADEEAARVAPDGAWLAYVSNVSGRNEIWIRPFQREGTAQQVSTDGGVEPVWGWDSRELFYRSGLDMIAVEVAPGDELALSPPHRLFTGRFESNPFEGGANFDVSLDGSRFLMVRRKETTQPTVIHVVVNWPEVLLGPDG